MSDLDYNEETWYKGSIIKNTIEKLKEENARLREALEFHTKEIAELKEKITILERIVSAYGNIAITGKIKEKE